ncbi:CCA tRNA nucleotidyltransferase [Candidatus Peregrinibacteria bacterium]|jgi:putative nucleotidyltransferase with HDIG domain|nr:CCA tRNA nucleotidyltransferase [Candidatus Peregrinibacteria bacterium]MBT4056223.1 CCA tRNA nucleotidyltransferase [Candidatus Peregrinibacteria bacterium]
MKPTSIQIIEQLKKAGHEAYWAGGCVRDMLLGTEPKDFDIVTSAKPDEIEDLLEKTIPIGKEFGVILAIQNGHNFEVATFRSDAGYSDGRRPDAVEFTNAKEDAHRRDFTINALFYDPTTDEIFDYTDGQKDMKEKLVRFIGDPEERIKEDHLRLLRAVRFKNNFDFQYHPDTYQAVKKHAHLITKISKERIRDELSKMIMGDNADQGFEELLEIGLLDHILPEAVKMKGVGQPSIYHHEGDVWDHSKLALKNLTLEEADPDPLPVEISQNLRWATFFHDIGKPETFTYDEERIRFDGHAEKGAEIATSIMKRLKFPKKDIKRVAWLIEHHMMVVPLMEMSKKRQRAWFLKEGFPELLEVYRADALGIDPIDLSAYHEIKRLYKHEIAELKLMPKQLISGDEIIKTLKIPSGKKVGTILADIKEKQLEGKLKTKEDALKYLSSL